MKNKEKDFDLHQSLMNEVYSKWKTKECGNMNRLEVVDKFFTKAHKVAVQLGNFNYQVYNGGFSQWIDNGYGEEDMEDLKTYFNKAVKEKLYPAKEILKLLKQIQFNITCPTCDGRGNEECGYCCGDGEIECPECEGEGTIECDECYGKGTIEDEDGNSYECSDCDGAGNIKCDECSGKGETSCGECCGDGEIECEYCEGNGELLYDWNILEHLDTEYCSYEESVVLALYEEIIKLYM